MRKEELDKYDLEFNEQVEKVIEYHIPMTKAKVSELADDYFETFKDYFGVTTYTEVMNELTETINEYFRNEVCKKDVKIDFLKYRLEVLESEMQNEAKATKEMFNRMLEFFEQEAKAATYKLKRVI